MNLRPGKLYLPAIQSSASVQKKPGLYSSADETWGAQVITSIDPIVLTWTVPVPAPIASGGLAKSSRISFGACGSSADPRRKFRINLEQN